MENFQRQGNSQKQFILKLLLVTTGVALFVASFIWFVNSQDYEPATGLIGAFILLVGFDFIQPAKKKNKGLQIKTLIQLAAFLQFVVFGIWLFSDWIKNDASISPFAPFCGLLTSIATLGGSFLVGSQPIRDIYDRILAMSIHETRAKLIRDMQYEASNILVDSLKPMGLLPIEIVASSGRRNIEDTSKSFCRVILNGDAGSGKR